MSSLAPRNKSLNAPLQLTSGEHNIAVTGKTFETDIRPKPDYAPLIPAAGMPFPETDNIAEPEFQDHLKQPPDDMPDDIRPEVYAHRRQKSILPEVIGAKERDRAVEQDNLKHEGKRDFRDSLEAKK